MADTQVKVCEISEDAKKIIKKFKFKQATTNCALILKVDKDKLEIVVDDELEDISPEELQEELPGHQPRFFLYLYKQEHDDGRISYPLCFVFYSPAGVKIELNMMYAGSKTSLVNETKMTKVFELRDLEDFTEEWLKTKLGIFR